MTQKQRKYGILAGHGQLLQDVIVACKDRQDDFFLLGFKDQTDPLLITPHDHAWVCLGQIGLALKHLHHQGVTHVVMAGRFQRPSLSELKLDTVGARWIAQLGFKALGDDGLLKGLIRKLENEGFKVVSPESLLGDQVLAPLGPLSPRPMPDVYGQDAAVGFEILRALSPYDCGQSLAFQEGRVLGIEGPEGTNALIQRAGPLADLSAEVRRPVLIKSLKLNQEIRADRPVVGPDTLRHLDAHGFGGLLIEAQGVMILDQKGFYDYLKTSDLFVVGLSLGSINTTKSYF